MSGIRHPSQVLSSGEVSGPAEGLELVLRQFLLERHNEEHLAATREGYEPFDFGPMEAAAERCVREYADRIGPVERALFGEWAGSGDPHVSSHQLRRPCRMKQVCRVE